MGSARDPNLQMVNITQQFRVDLSESTRCYVRYARNNTMYVDHILLRLQGPRQKNSNSSSYLHTSKSTESDSKNG